MTQSPTLPPTRALTATMKRDASVLFGLLALMWLLLALDSLPGVNLQPYGIRPRTTYGLVGIFFAPLLHVGTHHLLSNSLPFLLLGGIILIGGQRLFWSVSLFIVLFGGLGVWLFAGAHSVHIGASGLIFGYLGFLLARGFYERSILWILVGVVIFIGYGSLLYGVFPHQPGVSWQSHLFGLLAGVGAARLRGRHLRTLPGAAVVKLPA